MRKTHFDHLGNARYEDHVTVEFRKAADFVSKKLSLSCGGKNVG